MAYRYIALVGGEHDQKIPEALDVSDEVMNAIDMERRLTAGPLCILASKHTPTLPITDRALAIGLIFDKDNRRVSRGLGVDYTGSRLEKYLLENFWGEYVVLEAPEDGRSHVNVLRDPSGGVPCFYSLHHGSGFITSSISLSTRLNLYSRRVDWDFISHALTFTYLRTVRTGLSDINELLPGCALHFRGTSATQSLAWSPWTFVAAEFRCRDPRDAAVRVRDVTASAVKAWAELDEVILLELSGGLDSSIIAACLHGIDTRVVCCTLTSPVPGTDERPYAKQMTDRLGVDLHSVEIGVEGARIDFDISEDSAVPGMRILHYAVDQALSVAAAAHDVDSFFSGAGGDSVFCYLRNATPAVDAFKERGLSSGLGSLHDLATLHQCPVSKVARLALKKWSKGPRAPWKTDTSFLNSSTASVEFEKHPWFDSPKGTLPGDQEKVCELAGSQSFRDGMARTARWPMRFPLLSQPVVEACLAVPTWMWISHGRNRSIARSAFADILPPGILNRRSKGTYTNYCGAIHERNKAKMLDFLEAGQLQSRGLLDVEALQRFLTSDLSSRETFMRVFELCMVENWLRHQGA